MFIKKFHTHFFFNKFLSSNDFESLTKSELIGKIIADISNPYLRNNIRVWKCRLSGMTKVIKIYFSMHALHYNDLNRFISLTVDWNINFSLQIHKIVYWSRIQGQFLLLKGFTICVRAWCKQWWNAKVYCYYSMLNKVCRIPYFVAHRNFAVSLKI